MNPKCAKCDKTVYPIEKINCLDKAWHKSCFRCEVCNMTLNMKNYKGYDKKPYCNAHYPTTKHTVVADTPESRRIAQNTKVQSNIQYHKEFEGMKGKKMTVVDDPELQRIKQNTAIQSQIAYKNVHATREEMEARRPTQQLESGDIYPEEKVVQPVHDPEPEGNVRVRTNPGKISDYDPMSEVPKTGGTPYSTRTQQSSAIYDSDRGKDRTGGHRYSGSGETSPGYNRSSQDHQNFNEPPSPGYNRQSDRYSSGERTSGHNNQERYSSGERSPGYSRGDQYSPRDLPPYNRGDQYSPRDQRSSGYNRADPYPPREPSPNYLENGSSSSRRVGSIADYDPLNDKYGSIAGQYSPEPKKDAPPPQQPQPPPPSQLPKGDIYAGKGMVCRAAYDYTAADADEVSFMDGDSVIFCQPIDAGWMEGTVERTGQRGMLPSNYVERVA